MGVTIQPRRHAPEVWDRAEENRKFILYAINRTIGRGRYQAEEFFAVAVEAYCRAVETYPLRDRGGASFNKYAWLKIKGEVILAIKDARDSIHTPYGNPPHPVGGIDEIDILDDADADDPDDGRPRVARKVHAALKAIPPKNARILRLLFAIDNGHAEGASHREIAAEIGEKNYRSIGTYKNRGLAQMRRALSRMGVAS